MVGTVPLHPLAGQAGHEPPDLPARGRREEEGEEARGEAGPSLLRPRSQEDTARLCSHWSILDDFNQ